MATRLRFLVCENLEQEAAAAVQLEKLTDVMVSSFPAGCLHLPVGWDTLLSGIGGGNGECDRLDPIGGACFARLGEPPRCAGECHLHKFEHCFHLFLPADLVDEYMGRGAFLLTPGWLSNWWRYMSQWGLDQRTARDFFGECATSLVLVDTGIHEEGILRLQEAADFVGLPWEILPAGLDHLRALLSRIVLEWRLEEERRTSTAALSRVGRRSADYAMVFDLIGSLTGIMAEPAAIENTLEAFTMLFAPGSLTYLSVVDGRLGRVWSRPAGTSDAVPMMDRLLGEGQDLVWNEAGDGFVLRIVHQDETFGILRVGEIAYPEYMERYLEAARILGKVSGLAISNARHYREMQDAVNARDEFLSVAAHELKTPITSLRGFAQLAIRRWDGDGQPDPVLIRQAFQVIDLQSNKLTRLVSHLLDLSRIEARKLAIERAVVDVAALVRDVVELFRTRVDRHCLVERSPSSAMALVDPLRLEQVVVNLLDNAIKFSPDGGVIEVDLSMPTPEQVRIAVRDHGIGIPPEHRHRVFERLYQIEGNGTPRGACSGMGLGLYISRHIVELHGGRIEAESPSDSGTRFVVTLPVGESEGAQPGCPWRRQTS